MESIGFTLFSVAGGGALIALFSRLTSAARLARARDRMSAAIYETRLFVDSPARIVAAQLGLLYGCAQYLLYSVPALLVIGAVCALSFARLEARYGLLPLARDTPVLVRIVLAPDTTPTDVRFVSGGAATELTAPPLFARTTRTLYLRLRPPAQNASFSISVHDQTLTKELDVEGSIINAERASGLAALFAVGREASIPKSTGIERITVHHPSRALRLLGVSSAWWIHWLVLSTIAALLLRKRLAPRPRMRARS